VQTCLVDFGRKEFSSPGWPGSTHIEITEGLVDPLIELCKRFVYFVYPNRDHGLQEGKGTELHMQMLIVRYLIEHLPPGPQ
jgi:dipeptidyl-peptidase-4